MKRHILSIFFALAFSTCIAQKNNLEKANHVWTELSAKSVYLDESEASRIKESFFKSLAPDNDVEALINSLLWLQNEIGDSHAKIIYNDSLISNFDLNNLPPTTLEFYSILSEQAGEIPFENEAVFGTMLDEKYAYLLLLENDPMGKDAEDYFAYLQETIEELEDYKPKGWILDFRLNFGGAVFPMTAGLNSFIENGKVFSWKDVNNNLHDVNLTEGEINDGDTTMSFGEIFHISETPVAILTSGLTASAGEQTVIALRKNPRTTIIGEPTIGLTSGIEFVDLGDGVLFLYSTSFPVDYKQREYPMEIVPDIEIIGGDNFIDLMSDLKINAAIDWLNK